MDMVIGYVDDVYSVSWMVVMQLLMEFKSTESGLFYKYNKISQQQKFHLLNLVLKERRSIKQAARVVDINYSTAKTIVFFHRNHLKSYQFDLRLQSRNWRNTTRRVATYKEITVPSQDGEMVRSSQGQLPQFQVITSIGSKTTNIDFNSLQTRFMDNLLDHTTSQSGRDLQLSALGQLQLDQMQICQCERRQTRAQSAKQAAKLTFSPPAIRQEQSYQVISQQRKQQ